MVNKKVSVRKRDKRVSANVANFASKSLLKYDDPRSKHLREKRAGLEISALLLELVATLMNIQKKKSFSTNLYVRVR